MRPRHGEIERSAGRLGLNRGGPVAPRVPKWLVDGTRPSVPARDPKPRSLLPPGWNGRLEGRDGLARPGSGR